MSNDWVSYEFEPPDLPGPLPDGNYIVQVTHVWQDGGRLRIVVRVVSRVVPT